MFHERERRMRELVEREKVVSGELLKLLSEIGAEEARIDRECLESELVAFQAMTFDEHTRVMERKDLTGRQSRAFQKVYVLHGSPALKHVSRELVLKHAHLFTDDDIKSLSRKCVNMHWIVCVFIFIQIVLAALGDATQRIEFGIAVIVVFVAYPAFWCVWFECAARKFVRDVRAKEEGLL